MFGFDYTKFIPKHKPGFVELRDFPEGTFTQSLRTISQSNRRRKQLRRLDKSIRRKNRLITRLRRELNHKQFLIDNLMMEYAPDEMTEKQIEEWAKHQVKSSLVINENDFNELQAEK